MSARVHVAPIGDQAILASFGDRVDRELNRRARRLATGVEAARAEGAPFGVPVVGYASVLVPYDLEAVTLEEATAELERVIERLGDRPTDARGRPRLVEIPTRYGGRDAEDLPVVAEMTGLTPERIVELHASTVYDVFMLGFAPGFAYLGILPAAIAVPRRPTPRPRVPAGSVAIAERQTGVYPVETAGGWHLIGRTDQRLWDARREPPALLAPGDRVRFVPIG